MVCANGCTTWDDVKFCPECSPECSEVEDSVCLPCPQKTKSEPVAQPTPAPVVTRTWEKENLAKLNAKLKALREKRKAIPSWAYSQLEPLKAEYETILFAKEKAQRKAREAEEKAKCEAQLRVTHSYSCKKCGQHWVCCACPPAVRT